MDPVRNPFSPGAGTPPPELAGRQHLIDRAETTLLRAGQGRFAKSFMLIGLRGVGKTVLLNRIEALAHDHKHEAVLIEAVEDKPLADLLYPHLRRILLRLDAVGALSQQVKRALRVLKSFARSVKIKHGDTEISIEPEIGTGDSGAIEHDLPELLLAIAEAAKARGTVVALLIDELQYRSEVELSALILGVHRIAQRQLPLVLVAAGLPQLVALAGASKSYAERLFEFPEIGPLAPQDAYRAIVDPITREGESIHKKAAERIVAATEGYPYFLQAWGAGCWNEAPASPITAAHVEAATPRIVANLDESFFRVRFDRLTPAEKRYVRAMADLGPGPHRSGDIAAALGVKVQSVAPLRSALIKKGMIYSPGHGDTAFTVPMFDAYLRRQMPTRA